MDKAYSHKEHEDKIYEAWEKSGAFKPNDSRKTFSITLPPPNANAALHYGHAMYTVEDILIRYHRMLGESVLWLPGADHAGFETQVVYEKHLDKEGKSRFDFDRETLYKNIWDFVQGNRGTMENQLRKLGFSLDWSNLKFTLDDEIVKTVYKTFKKMHDDGLIYRDSRLVNYCTKHGTAFSDLEVDHVEKKDSLYYVRFKIKDSKDFITVATVRPETIYGDVSIAVNPKDKRYKKFVGKIAINPLNNNQLPIIADSYVKMDFGTGALKITPAHDENDFALAKKYNFPLIQIIETNGKLNSKALECEGLKILPAREKVVEILKSKEQLEKIEDYNHTVGTCYKCGNTLEPLPIPQWYVKVDKLAKPAIDAVKSGEIKIIPKRFEKIYYHWMNNIHDWNISRQVVWGIRIPAWKNTETGEWIVTEGESPKGNEWTQDTDTFDTWFSSGQWPFATLGFPNGELFKKFYPLNVMETGYDILFFWVARMIMLGIYVTGEVPFKNVYLHGIVRDSKGVKMSKSKGNVINPLEILEKYGADALRMSLISGAGAGSDQNYSESKVVGYRNFANKIWNAVRFVKEFESTESNKTYVNSYNKHLAETIALSTKNIDNYKLNNAAEMLYKRFWNNFCDIRIEDAKKGKLNKEDLMRGIITYLKLLHPFVPFVTEAVWKELGNDTLLITENWPSISNGQEEKLQ
ncbi:MAG: valine--tRNA ligase [Microgenomates group bacterium]